jgi:P2 family phage contractile tail tube protein
MTEINRMTQCAVFMDGNSLLGKVAEITLPVIKPKMVEHKAVGMQGTLRFPTGFEATEGKIKWASYYPDVAKRFARMNKFIPIQVRSSVESITNVGVVGEKALVIVLTIGSKGIPLGDFKQGDNVEMDTDFECYYMKQTFDNKDIVEFDPLNNLYVVDGVDQLAQYRKNLGL